jgi:tetratricopeptide (TPR) repeat protein
LGAAQAVNHLGFAAYNLGEYTAARALFAESLNLEREMGDKRGIASSLNNLGHLALGQGDYAAGRALYEESLSLRREIGEKEGISASLSNLGVVAMGQGGYVAARKLLEESMSLDREMGNKLGIGIALNNLGSVAYFQGEYAIARKLQEECLALCKEMDEKQIMAHALLGLGLVDLAEKIPDAREYILHSLRLRVETGEQFLQTSSLVGVAGLALQAGKAVRAAQMLGVVETALKALNVVLEDVVIPLHAETLAAVKGQLGEAAFQSAWGRGVNGRWRRR